MAARLNELGPAAAVATGKCLEAVSIGHYTVDAPDTASPHKVTGTAVAPLHKCDPFPRNGPSGQGLGT
jgi:hypothetical protein